MDSHRVAALGATQMHSTTSATGGRIRTLTSRARHCGSPLLQLTNVWKVLRIHQSSDIQDPGA